MAQVISQSIAANMIKEAEGSQFFSVTFVKRTDNTIREMTCRKGVKKYLKGGELKFSPEEKGLVVVWDAQVEDASKAYRMIALDSIREIKMNGNKFIVR